MPVQFVNWKHIVVEVDNLVAERLVAELEMCTDLYLGPHIRIVFAVFDTVMHMQHNRIDRCFQMVVSLVHGDDSVQVVFGKDCILVCYSVVEIPL